VVDAIAEGEMILWQGILNYESVRIATGVLTPSFLSINSSMMAAEIDHTELVLRFARAKVNGALHQPASILGFFTRGNFAHTACLRFADETQKRLFFLTKDEALKFCSAISDWCAKSPR
jgi:hypothetical protein